MGLTITADMPKPEQVSRNLYEYTGYIAFDSSYAFGGESISTITGKFKNCLNVVCESKGGYTFEYDDTNSKLKVFAPAPPIVYDEVQTIASTAITLDYPAAAILNIASATATWLLVEPSATLGAGECQLSAAMSAGARPTINFYTGATGAVTVAYITQAWADIWNNRVASSALTTATHVASLGAVACYIESCEAVGTTGSSRPKYIRGGDAAATLECEVDFTDAGGSNLTTMTFYATDAITAATVTYIELPSSGFVYNRFVEDEDLTMTTGTGASAYPILFTAFGSQIPDYTAAAERDPHSLMMPEADALGTSAECAIDYHKIKTVAGTQIRTNDTTSDAVSLTYVWGNMAEIPGLVPLEVKNATNLSALTTVRFRAVGYA